ncbi:MAG: tetratricopeptide repeat protein [Chloroflexota bacterium]|nr:tetratricopeptide repeat protein [Chloroflexota bacterium]
MSKRRRKKRKRRRAPRGRKSQSKQKKTSLSQTLERADRLIERGRAWEAIELLEPLLESHPREANLHYYVGYAHARDGDMWGALGGYERAQELEPNLDYQLPLALLYMEIGLRAHGLHAFRQLAKRRADFPVDMDVSEMVAAMEQEMAGFVYEHELTTRRAEKGLRDMERGQIELHHNNYPASIAASRRAIESLGDWPPSHNNLSLALFWDGQPEEAIAVVQRTIEAYPDNVHALVNGIRFLVWNGREDEARALWARLEKITPQNPDIRRKIVEAAAVLGEDETVYQLLDGASDEYKFDRQQRYFLAIAEANTGRHRAARRHWRALRQEMPGVNDLLAALKAGRPGPGWAERYPYFHSVNLVPIRELDELVKLTVSDETDTHRRKKIKRFAVRFPQTVLLAEKLIWEEDRPDAGITFLTTLATPAAYAALRRFGLSQAGEDNARMQALIHLLQAGEITSDEILHMWLDGEWRDVQLRGHAISDDLVEEYAPEVIDLLDRGLSAFRQDDYEQAERLFLRALELDPQAKRVYNNLGTAYAYQGKHTQAKEIFHTALEIDPLYVMPRCNLAAYLLDDGEIQEAQAMLKPLADVTQFHPQDIVFYQYTQARILIRKEEFDAAKNLLEAALKIQPDYEPAQNLLERLERANSEY